MARPKTVDELLAEAEAGKSGATLGQQEALQREEVLTPEEKARRKKRQGQSYFEQGREAVRTILNPFAGTEK